MQRYITLEQFQKTHILLSHLYCKMCTHNNVFKVKQKYKSLMSDDSVTLFKNLLLKNMFESTFMIFGILFFEALFSIA